MERDQRPVPHRRTRRIGSRIGFLVCFNWGTSSSSSSSSMKISRSILSPGRRDSNLSLSSSLSRRLRSNGSLKGGAGGGGGQASPMFPVTGSNKKKGLGFEIDEPSSPKVTCIGLVRVKTKTKHSNNKKNKKKMRTRSKRRSGGGEASFRKIEQNQEGMNHHHQPECLPHRNHRWIHLPFTICEGLKALGAEINCFVPCSGRSSSSSSSFSSSNWGSEREKGREKRRRRRCGSRVMSSSSCGAVFMRWLFALEDNDEHKKEEKKEDRDFHVAAADNEIGIHEFSEQKGREFKEAMPEKVVVEEEEEEEEERRFSICVPPRNALLLMRCRSEPFRTSSLATRFWDDPSCSNNNLKADESNEEHYEEKQQQVVVVAEEEEEEDKPLKIELPGEENKEEEIVVISRRVSVSAREEQENLIKEDDDDDEQLQVDPDEEEEEVKKEENPENAGTEEEAVVVAEAHELRNSENEVLEEEEDDFNVPAIEENSKLQEDKTSKCENREQRRSSFSSSTIPILLPQPEADDPEPEPATLPLFGSKMEEKVANLEEERAEMWNNEEKIETQKEEEEEEEEEAIQEPSFEEPEQEEQNKNQALKEEEEEGRRSEDSNRAASYQVLPECLLLMMCEPKVSMEVSKETWVCSNDFIRHHRNNLHPHHHQQLPPEKQQPLVVNKINGADEPKKKTYTNHQLRQLKQKKPRDHKITNAAAPPPQPPRSSCSKVEPLVVAIEKKLVNGAKAPEPFVLPRCKSEPMRSSDKLAPEACFWKNMKLEPHRQTTLGVGATEVGS